MKNIILSVLALLVAITSFGRNVTGKVIDETGEPIDFVNVVVYCDSVYVAGNITDVNGQFAISAQCQGAMTAKISFVGYEPFTAEVPASGDFGVISLTPSSVKLNEVEVKAVRPYTRFKGNSLITSVEDSPLAIAGTANDVLTRIPMVLDNDGAIEVFGKGSPAIYINGRLVTDNQDLSQLNSQDIKSVELITNPGAKYAADVQSVIRIRTKPPKGDGWSGTLRTDNGFQHYFRTGNSIDLKYRTRGLELFANYGYWFGDNRFDRTNNMTTTTSTATYHQFVRTEGRERYNDMTGKIGFSWMINDRHSVGAYYQNSWNRHNTTGTMPSEIWQNGSLLERVATNAKSRNIALPRHYTNIYYNGLVGKLGIDFNADYLWNKNRETVFNDESSEIVADRVVSTSTTNRNRMFAEKLTLSHPLWKGEIEIGEEYTNSRMTNLFTANLAEIGDADNRIDESNIAAFVEVRQEIGRFQVGAGLRYEHVNFEYFVDGSKSAGQSKSYNNLFPSLSLSTQFGAVRMGLNYTGKTVRPGYGQLDGAVSYVNRLTYETGNPYLKSTKLQTVEYTAQWRNYFAQVSYIYFKDGVYHVTTPFGDDGEATLIKTENLDHRHYLQAFVGGQFNLAGVWMPKANIGVRKQWLSLPVDGRMMKMGTPIFLFQWQNAVKLPLDIWLNIDAQLMTRGWDNNIYLCNTPWNLSAKLYKGFHNNAFSVTLEAKDIFNSAANDFKFYNNTVLLEQRNFSPGTSVILTLQYRFNVTRDRYRGSGAGGAEKARLQ